MERSIYLNPLKEFKDYCDSIPNTKMSAFLKQFYLANIAMRYENSVESDPYGPEKYGEGNLRLLARKSL